VREGFLTLTAEIGGEGEMPIAEVLKIFLAKTTENAILRSLRRNYGCLFASMDPA
jgi:hypothetical protein